MGAFGAGSADKSVCWCRPGCLFVFRGRENCSFQLFIYPGFMLGLDGYEIPVGLIHS